MKINFNPVIRNNSECYIKINKNYQPKMHSNANLNGIGCLANYNLPFCSRKIYSIDYDGNCETFSNIASAANKYDLGHCVVSRVLEGKQYVANGKTFVYADQVETGGEINPEKLMATLLVFRDVYNQPIYSIDSSGNVIKYENITDASQKTGMSRPFISQSLTGTRGINKDCIFRRAFDIEKRDADCKLLKDEEWNPIIDTAVINKIRKEFLYKKHDFPVIRIDKNGNTKIYSCSQAAADDIGCERYLIRQSIVNEAMTQGKYAFARLSEMVLFDEKNNDVFDENNNFAIDLNKVAKRVEMVFGNNL